MKFNIVGDELYIQRDKNIKYESDVLKRAIFNFLNVLNISGTEEQKKEGKDFCRKYGGYCYVGNGAEYSHFDEFLSFQVYKTKCKKYVIKINEILELNIYVSACRVLSWGARSNFYKIKTQTDIIDLSSGKNIGCFFNLLKFTHGQWLEDGGVIPRGEFDPMVGNLFLTDKELKYIGDDMYKSCIDAVTKVIQEQELDFIKSKLLDTG
jgi:hypothetical protein